MGLVLVRQYTKSIGFGLQASFMDGRGIQKLKFGGSQNQAMRICFFAHISARNDSNLIFRASQEFHIIHLHNPFVKNLNIVARSYAMDKKVMQDFFFQILQYLGRGKKLYREDFKNVHYFLSLFFPCYGLHITKIC